MITDELEYTNQLSQRYREIEGLIHAGMHDLAMQSLSKYESEFSTSNRALYQIHHALSLFKELRARLALLQGRFEDALNEQPQDPIVLLIALAKTLNYPRLLSFYPLADRPAFDTNTKLGMTGDDILNQIKIYLEQSKDIRALKIFWTLLLKKRRSRLADADSDEARKTALDRIIKALEMYLSSCKLTGLEQEIVRINAQLSMFTTGKPLISIAENKAKIDELKFWELIESSFKNSSSESEGLQLLFQQLEKYSRASLASFQKILHKKLNESSNWKVWGAAYLLRDGCSDDSFLYFRAWLITQGKAFFEAVLNDPDNAFALYDLTKDNYFQCESLLSAASEVYETKSLDCLSDKVPFKEVRVKGTKWEEDTLPSLYPKISALLTAKSNIAPS